MASSHVNDNAPQCKTCRCGEGDANIWTTKTPENLEKQVNKCPNCQVIKSGPLLVSSRGIGWTSWKKRWFVLTRTSLVFFRSDPNVPPPKGSEPNLTLGGIDLTNSGSVVVKPDKKLLTVLFPDGRDGRTFTLKAETLEDLNEWKTALENALAQAPSAALAMGQSGILRTDVADSIEASFEQWRDRRPGKSLVVGRPILLALEDIDGSPSFLEKALRYIEQYGIKVEGILRQSADVEEVERRVQEYEQGKNEFSADEDAHVIGDCIKHVLRELPSSPVPASCCTALVEAYRTDRRSRVDALRAAIYGSFPEPNLHLLQRILKMMRIVASHKSENRMTLSALAACMAPLLLRALLHGDCEVDDDFKMGGDGSLQLLQAAAAANHAQAIVIILLEEYERIFNEDLSLEGSLSSEVYTDSEDDDFEDEESTDDDILEDDGYHDADIDVEADIDDDSKHSSNEKHSRSGSEVACGLSDDKDSDDHNMGRTFSGDKDHPSVLSAAALNAADTSLLKKDAEKPLPIASATVIQRDELLNVERSNSSSAAALTSESRLATGSNGNCMSTMHKSVSHILPSSVSKFNEDLIEPSATSRKPTVWGRMAARKNLSMESIEYSSEDDEVAIQKLENSKTDLQNKITKEVKGNAILQASLEKRKEALHERRWALEQDVEKLREQLQKERDLKESLESGLMNIRRGQLPITAIVDCKTKADLEEIALTEADIINLKHKVSDLRGQLSNQMKLGYASLCESCSQQLYRMHQLDGADKQKEIASTAVVREMDNVSQTEHSSSGRDPQNGQALRSGISESPSLKEITAGTNDLHKNSSIKDENVLSRANCKDANTKTLGSPSSSTMQPTQKQHLDTNKNSSVPKGSNFASFSDEPAISHKVVSKRTSSKYDPQADSYYEKKSVIGMDTQKPRNEMANPPPMKPETNAVTLTSTSLVSNDDQSTAESLPVSHNILSAGSFSSGHNAKKVDEDSGSLPNRKDPQKQQSSATNLDNLKSFGLSNVPSSGDPTSLEVSSKKYSSRGEEIASVTSSALTKLTSRLQFLKERRVQLVNELQNLDANRTSAPEGPLPTSSR
ncbi:rho GTPase-activating protein 7-like isoform X2 [Dioscorea cayenensis subsp. rotundata]|uniref:Rho GTPase-activating protein 7-like isoform X2 n=1 Tax=Dioscorea cayennensis subsp. rotundata TaxID=55577 RepID=A0AB40BCX8_DIOCR|nr:rho GTPase-activating protein 7-like isoform X2 [Dioscorea cayenensis subsp. rotundata]